MKTLAEHFGAEWQNDVKPGGRKLSQFRAAFKIQKTPPCHSQEKEADPTVFVKLFDPCSNWTWFCTEWDEDDNEAFGLVRGHEEEFGYVSLTELSEVKDRFGIGIELDMHFEPQPLSEALGRTEEPNQTTQQLSTPITNIMATTEIPAELKAATDSLLDLVSAHVGTAIFQRVQAFVMEKSGSKLQAFLSDSSRSIEDRAALVTELTDILRKQEFDRLPNLASGQAAPTKQPAALTPAPAPALTPEPKAEPAPAPKTNGSAVNPKFAGETFSVPTNGIACTETPTAVPPPADPMAALTAALKAFMPPPPAAPQIDEAQVRRLVRTELATILESVAAVLRKS